MKCKNYCCHWKCYSFHNIHQKNTIRYAYWSVLINLFVNDLTHHQLLTNISTFRIFLGKNAFTLTVFIWQQRATDEHVFIYSICASSLSSRGWSIWCLRRRGELRTCSALWFSSVSYARKRKRRAALCPACLTGCWRPCRASQPPRTANRHTCSLVHSWHAPNFLPHPVIAPSVSYRKLRAQMWSAYLRNSYSCVFFCLVCSHERTSLPLMKACFYFHLLSETQANTEQTVGVWVGHSWWEWTSLQEIIVSRF